MFKIKITIKQLGKKKSKITDKIFYLDKKPNSGEELIKYTVRACVSEFNKKNDESSIIRVLTEDELESQSEIGKIAFGFHYNTKNVDVDEAVTTAMSGFEDGLVRIFWKDEEIVDLQKEIEVDEEDLFTFIRLTMLTGW